MYSIYNGNSAQQQKVMEKNHLKDINSYTQRKQIRGTPLPQEFMISFIKTDIKM